MASATEPALASASGEAARRKVLGQWALGHFEPLNADERIKADDDPLNVRTRIEKVYARAGFDSIAPDDLRGRFRWEGLFTQRRPGLEGGRTATLEPQELEDRFFLLRVRSDAGLLATEQLRTIAGISQDFARDTAHITGRQSIQMHWVGVEDMPSIWERLEPVGLSTSQTCGDTPRAILGSPVAGVAAEEIVDATPAIREIVNRYVGNRKFSNLPRKFKSAISGSPYLDVAHETNCLSFVGVQHPELGPGFDVWVGGGLSINPMLAKRLGAWVGVDDVPDVWGGVLALFRDYGYRRARTRARLKFLVADWGPERFREVLEDEYLQRPLADGPPPAAPPNGRRDHVGVYRQADGKFYVGAAPVAGRASGTMLAGLADLAADIGSDRIRLTGQQKIVVLDVPERRVDGLVAGLASLGLQARPSEFRRGTMACTGIEYCKRAIVETKATARDLVGELERRFPTFDQPITVSLNGCPFSCARFQTADIGLRGVLATNGTGETVDGFQVSLGGALGVDPAIGRRLPAHKIIANELPAYVGRLAETFLRQRGPGEPFATWARGAEEEDLR